MCSNSSKILKKITDFEGLSENQVQYLLEQLEVPEDFLVKEAGYCRVMVTVSQPVGKPLTRKYCMFVTENGDPDETNNVENHVEIYMKRVIDTPGIVTYIAPEHVLLPITMLVRSNLKNKELTDDWEHTFLLHLDMERNVGTFFEQSADTYGYMSRTRDKVKVHIKKAYPKMEFKKPNWNLSVGSTHFDMDNKYGVILMLNVIDQLINVNGDASQVKLDSDHGDRIRNQFIPTFNKYIRHHDINAWIPEKLTFFTPREHFVTVKSTTTNRTLKRKAPKDIIGPPRKSTRLN